MNGNNRTVWSSLWNNSTGASKNPLVDVMYSNNKVPPTLSQVMAHIRTAMARALREGLMLLVRSDTSQIPWYQKYTEGEQLIVMSLR